MKSRTNNSLDRGSVDSLLAAVGAQLRTSRLEQGLDQNTLATRAGVSRSAITALENGAGSTLRVLVSVAAALGHTDWLQGIAPQETFSPLAMLDTAQRSGVRRRAPRTSGRS